MQPFPHFYWVQATATVQGDVPIGAAGLRPIRTATPKEFDGPGNQWSPEHLLVAAVVDCFVLTFRGVARVSKLDWRSLSCDAAGRLERIEHQTQFTEFVLHVTVQVPDGTSEALARRVAEKADETCLVAKSLKARVRLEVDIETTVGTHFAADTMATAN